MGRLFNWKDKTPEDYVFTTMLAVAFALIGFGFLSDTPRGIAGGVLTIINTQAGLITDSISIGGLGAAFVNAGLVMLISIALLKIQKLRFTGISVACLFLMAGFSLFGKDICNIFPIIFGGWLYARYKREHFGRYLYISLFGTALAPVVTEIAELHSGSLLLRILFGGGIGVLVGFILPAIASYTIRIHQGYNLYNVGFAAGLVGMVIASLSKSFGHTFDSRFEWSSGNDLRLSVFLFGLFAAMVLTGFLLNGRSFQNAVRITRHSGRAVADFILLDGYAVTVINMGIIGAAAVLYVFAVGGELNGPTIGGIFTICGFGAFGKHLKNIIPPVLGVVASSFFMVWRLDDPNVLLAALFATGLAPIAGQFGWGWGMIAGAVHASVVMNVGVLHGGLNLYNNGFSAGLVCIVLIPLIESVRREKPHAME